MKTGGTFAVGAGAAIIGLLVGMGIGGSDGSEEAERAKLQEEMSSQVAAMNEKLDGLEGRFDKLSGEVQSVGSGIGDRTEQQFAALSDKLGEMGSSVNHNVETFSKSLPDSISLSIKEHFDGLTSRIAAMSPPDTGDEQQPAGQMISPGGTLIFGDGAARVFLSAVSLDSNSARVAINGTGLQTVSVGKPVSAGSCDITLTGVKSSSAMFDSTCGGSGSGEQANAEPPGLGKGTELQVASATSFGDGAAQVYLSQVDPASGTARLAINGTATTTLAVGDSVDVGKCTVSLTGMTDSAVSVDASC